MIDLANLSKKQIFGFILLILLIVAIPVGVYMAQQQQIFKSKASTNLSNAFEVKDGNNQIIHCTGDDLVTCITPTDEVTITISDLDALLPPSN